MRQTRRWAFIVSCCLYVTMYTWLPLSPPIRAGTNIVNHHPSHSYVHHFPSCCTVGNHPRCRKFVTILAAAKFCCHPSCNKVHFQLCCADVNIHFNCGKATQAVVKVLTISNAVNHPCLSCRIKASYVQRPHSAADDCHVKYLVLCTWVPLSTFSQWVC